MTKADLLNVLKEFPDDDTEILARVWHPNQEWPIDLKVTRWDYEVRPNKLILVTQ